VPLTAREHYLGGATNAFTSEKNQKSKQKEKEELKTSLLIFSWIQHKTRMNRQTKERNKRSKEYQIRIGSKFCLSVSSRVQHNMLFVSSKHALASAVFL